MSVSSPLPCGGYWLSAGRALRDVRMITFAALMVALRVVLRAASIPITESLYVSFSFLPSALGAVVCGPYLALLSGAASDVLGYLAAPRGGPFYPLFTLVAMLECLLYALFLFRAPLRVWRAAAAKLSVNVVCNILLTPVLLSWMYGQAIRVYLATRVVKNLLLFPLEAALLYLLLRAALPALARLGFRGR